MKPITVVDIFAGPGGLSEGFSRFTGGHSSPRFRVALSAEKDPAACQTLRLRAFHRLCGGHAGVPDSYFDYLRGTSDTPWDRATRRTWMRAEQEARQLTLGSASDNAELDRRIRALVRQEAHWVLIGGPPCQAYSLIGRSRNRGIAGYRPEKDHRHFLYREYLTILARHRPSIFVMENVKGILSSRPGGRMLFPTILEDLSDPGRALTGRRRTPRYQIHALSVPTWYEPGQAAGDIPATNFIIRAERYGVPQARHRVILVGIRSDLARHWGTSPILPPASVMCPAEAALRDLPMLRSGVTGAPDHTVGEWQRAIGDAWNAVRRRSARGDLPRDVTAVVRESLRRLNGRPFAADRGGHFLPNAGEKHARRSRPKAQRNLHDWLDAPRLQGIINHETRSHMPSDLARYLFAASFAQARGESPKASDFPRALWPKHRNWRSGHFADRFRVQIGGEPARTITSHIAKDGHYYIHPDPVQCRSFTVREAARVQTFPDDYLFMGNRTQQFVQVGNAVPPLLAHAIAKAIWKLLS